MLAGREEDDAEDLAAALGRQFLSALKGRERLVVRVRHTPGVSLPSGGLLEKIIDRFELTVGGSGTKAHDLDLVLGGEPGQQTVLAAGQHAVGGLETRDIVDSLSDHQIVQFLAFFPFQGTAFGCSFLNSSSPTQRNSVPFSFSTR